MRLPFVPQPAVCVSCPKGQVIVNPLPGDFLLVRGKDFYSKLITFGQKMRFGDKSPFSYWTHVALVTGTDGSLIEACSGGVISGNIAKYTEQDYLYVATNASNEDRAEAVKFADYCLSQTYGWGTILSIAISLLTGLKFSFGFDGQEICSGLVARSLERTHAIFNRDPSHITPADLAMYYNAPYV